MFGSCEFLLVCDRSVVFKIHSNIIYSPRINLIISSLKMNLMQLHVSGWGYFLVLFVCHHAQYLTFFNSSHIILSSLS